MPHYLRVLILFEAVLGFLPVTLFLLSLLYLDSFKLVRLTTVVQLILYGCTGCCKWDSIVGC